MAKTPNNGALTQACSVLTHTILGTLVIMLLGLRTMKLWQRSFVSSKYYSFWHAYLDSLCLLYQAKRFPYPSSQPALPMLLYVALRERSRFTQETTLATLEHIKYSIFLYSSNRYRVDYLADHRGNKSGRGRTPYTTPMGYQERAGEGGYSVLNALLLDKLQTIAHYISYSFEIIEQRRLALWVDRDGYSLRIYTNNIVSMFYIYQ